MVAPKGQKKPAKPYPEYPLTPHPNGQWCKRVGGKLYFFGPWSDPQAALDRYKRELDDLRAGREPVRPGGTLKALCNAYLTHQQHKLDAGEIVWLTFDSYRRTCAKVLDVLGAGSQADSLRPQDFERLRAVVAKTLGPRALAVFVQHVRSVFKYGYESGILDAPTRFGPAFKAPSKAVIRKLRASKPPRLFDAKVLRGVIDAAIHPLRAMILLGINCGFGNADCGALPLSALDLAGGWVTFPRPKTGIARRCKLWPETVRALKAWLAVRPAACDAAAGLVFVTPTGKRYNGGKWGTAIGYDFRRLLRKLGAWRPGLSFYALRVCFETVAGGNLDQVAVDAVMGHLTPGMGTAYRDVIGDDRLEAVARHVRSWLYGK